MQHTLTLDLPEPIFKRLQEMASATALPLERVARQSIEGNLPPSVANAPREMQLELLSLQSLSVGELRRVASGQVPAKQQRHHEALLEKNALGTITSEENDELARLRQKADQIMLRKAYAWALLRWHGTPVPSLDDLPLV